MSRVYSDDAGALQLAVAAFAMTIDHYGGRLLVCEGSDVETMKPEYVDDKNPRIYERYADGYRLYWSNA